MTRITTAALILTLLVGCAGVEARRAEQLPSDKLAAMDSDELCYAWARTPDDGSFPRIEQEIARRGLRCEDTGAVSAACVGHWSSPLGLLFGHLNSRCGLF